MCYLMSRISTPPERCFHGCLAVFQYETSVRECRENATRKRYATHRPLDRS